MDTIFQAQDLLDRARAMSAGLLVLVATCALSLGACSRNRDQAMLLIRIPRLSTAPLSADPDALAWRGAVAVELGDPERKRLLPLGTSALMRSDEDSMSLLFVCEEPQPNKLIVDGHHEWANDAIEIFFEPNRDVVGVPYHHLMIIASGRVVKSRRYHVYPKYFGQSCQDETWDPKIETQVLVREHSWTCAVRIPFAEIKHAPGGSLDGGWRLNLCRTRPGRAPHPDLAWSWSPLLNGSFHTPARFGYAVLEGVTAASAEVEIERVVAAQPSDASVARAADAAILARIQALVARLADGDTASENSARSELVKIASEGRALCDRVRSAITAVIATTNGQKSERDFGRLREQLYLFEFEIPDNDPPPRELHDHFASFEPRVQRDPDGNSLGYRLLKPLDYDPNGSYPLLLFLHGGRERGSDNRYQLAGGALDFLDDRVRRGYPAFVIAPQCPVGEWWGDTRSTEGSREVLKASSNYRLAEQPSPVTRMLLATVEAVRREFPEIDGSRIYIGGGSMGGFGTWECVMRRPDLFAAAFVLCGGGDDTRVQSVKDLPLWIFHGAKDPRVKVEAARNMVAALKACGGAPRYTEYPDRGHDLGPCYTYPEVLEWLFAQRRP
jgi:predicted esterase